MTYFSTFVSRLLINRAELELLTPLRIGTGKSRDVTESDNPVMKDVLGRPVIPGASLKGAIRSHIEALLRRLQMDNATQYPNLVCDFLSDEHSCAPKSWIDQQKKLLKEKKITRDAYDHAVLNRLCLICRVFGSNYAAAKLAIRDLPVMEDYWGEQYLMRDGVAIDRERGTAANKRKYDFEAVPAGTRFEFALQLDNATEAETAITLLGVRSLAQSHIQLGGAKSRGLGWCRLENINIERYTDPIEYALGKPSSPFDIDDYAQNFLEKLGQKHA